MRALLVAAALVSAFAEPHTRRVYVSALDKDDVAVDGLTAADFAVKEGGRPGEIVRVEPAVAKMQIAILVDDNGTGLFRVSVARFIEALLGRAEFSISTVNGQMLKLVDFTTDHRDLSEAVLKLGARPATNDGGQLLDGITATSLDLARRGAARPIIVALTVGGADVTPIPPHEALDQLRRSGAALHVVSVISSAMRPTAPPDKASDLLNENLGLHEVLGDGPKRSGGHREEISAIAGVTTGLHKLAEQLKHQYVIEYNVDRPSDRLAVSVKKKGVTLRAPTYIPDKL
jgi:VWFA-related protein